MSVAGKRNYTKIMGLHQLILSLGGNVGNKAENFHRVKEILALTVGEITVISNIYESPAWGFDSQDLFWNQVVIIKTRLDPYEILEEIGKIEAGFGRIRLAHGYASRQMDIDILFYDDLIILTPELTIPHPMIALRKFVLVPLADIVPSFLHPMTGEKVTDLLDKCPDEAELKKIC